MKYPKVCIIILNWNGKEMLKDCLSSLFKLTNYPNYKVIVVDNGSTDGSVEFVKKNFKKVDILALDKNYGFAIGNNIGMKYALKKYSPKYILLLNNDTEIIQKDWLEKMVEVAESNKKVGIIGCTLLFPNKKIQCEGIRSFTELIFPSYIHYIESRRISNDYEFVLGVPGACFMIKREVIRKIGMLSEIYSPASYEDVDYFVRARKVGFSIVFISRVKLIHKLSTSWKKIKELERFTLISRNYFIFILKHFKRYFLISLIIRILVSIVGKSQKIRKMPTFRVRNFIAKRIIITLLNSIEALKLCKGEHNNKNFIPLLRERRNKICKGST